MIRNPSQEAGLFSACTDADGRIRRCLGCEYDCFGYDALSNWQKCSAGNGRLPELCRPQSHQHSGSGGDLGLLSAEYHRPDKTRKAPSDQNIGKEYAVSQKRDPETKLAVNMSYTHYALLERV